MIDWRCDGCGAKVESQWIESPDLSMYMVTRRNVYMTADPVPPPGWWVASVTVKIGAKGVERTGHKLFLACCGRCMDDVAARQPSINLKWTQQEGA